MLKDKDIVCVSNTTWYGEYTKSTVQLMSRFAHQNRVLFIEYPFTVKDMLLAIMGKKKAPVKQLLGINKRLVSLKSDVGSPVYNLLMPPILPVYFIKNKWLFEKLQNFNGFVYRTYLKKILKKLKFKNPIVINAYNAFYGLPLMGRLNQSLDIYYCYDGYDIPRYGERIILVDENFSKSVDAVITTSDYLKQEKLKCTKSSFVVKNGVDYDIFKAQLKSSPHQRKNKIMGYIGSLDHRFNIDIVEHAVKNLPDFEFHFTGGFLGTTEIKQRLNSYANVKFFAPVKPDEVPALLATYDVGIIPYTITEYNKNIYPLKINEYLAVGVPVVMTAFADLKDFEGMVSVAKDNESFTEALLHETRSDSEELIKKRTDFAELNSWDNRTLEFSSIMEQFLTDNK